MTQYIVLLPTSESEWATASEQQRADVYAAHTDFARLLGERGHKMTGGSALARSAEARVVRGALDNVTVTEGPYAESVEQLSGFYTIETDDIDDLVKVCGRLAATPTHRVIEVRAFDEAMG